MNKAKVLKVKLPPAPSATYPSGSTIARFSVPGRPVPWSVPPKLRRKSPRLVAWQRSVRLWAGSEMAGRLPHDGPVRLHVVFHLLRGKRPGDTSNYFKGTEDALQGVVFLNDTQVVETSALRIAVCDPSLESAHVVVKASGEMPAESEG